MEDDRRHPGTWRYPDDVDLWLGRVDRAAVWFSGRIVLVSEGAQGGDRNCVYKAIDLAKVSL